MKLLCLANSYKEGGRCIAGVMLDEHNNPIIENNQPIWIRPIFKAKNGQIPNELCVTITPLDIIEIDNTNKIGTGYQLENTTFKEDKITIVARADNSILSNLYSSTEFIFNNNKKAFTEDTIKEVNHSLILIKVSDFNIIEKTYPKIRIEINYKNNCYDLPVTDPVFLNNYKKNKDILDNIENINVVLSIGAVHNGFYNKLVSSIIY